MLTLKQAAEFLCELTDKQISPQTLRWQIHNQRLAAVKAGRDWLVSTEELERYARHNMRLSPIQRAKLREEMPMS